MTDKYEKKLGKTGIRQCAFLEEVNVNHNLKETGILVFKKKKKKSGIL